MARWVLPFLVLCSCPSTSARPAGPSEECSALLSAFRDSSFGGVDVSDETQRRLRSAASGRAFELCADVDLAPLLVLSISRLDDRRVVVNANAFDRPAREVRHVALAIINGLTGKAFAPLAPGTEEQTIAAVRDWWTREGSRNPAGVIAAHRTVALRQEKERREALARGADLTAGQSWTVRKTADGPFTPEERQAMAGPGVYAWRGTALVLLNVTTSGAVEETSVSPAPLLLASRAQAPATWPFAKVLPLSAVVEGRPTPPEVIAELDRLEPALLTRLTTFDEKPVFVRDGDLIVSLRIRRR